MSKSLHPLYEQHAIGRSALPPSLIDEDEGFVAFEDLNFLNGVLEGGELDAFLDAFNDAAYVAEGDDVQLGCTVGPSIPIPEAASAPVPSVSKARFFPSVHDGSASVATVRSSSSLLSLIAVVGPFPAVHQHHPAAAPVAAPFSASGMAVVHEPARSLSVEQLLDHKRAHRQEAIARWMEKRKRRVWGAQRRFPEYECRRHVATRRPRVNGRFIREQPVFVPVSQLEGGAR
jgi:hypothetical protein